MKGLHIVDGKGVVADAAPEIRGGKPTPTPTKHSSTVVRPYNLRRRLTVLFCNSIYGGVCPLARGAAPWRGALSAGAGSTCGRKSLAT